MDPVLFGLTSWPLCVSVLLYWLFLIFFHHFSICDICNSFQCLFTWWHCCCILHAYSFPIIFSLYMKQSKMTKQTSDEFYTKPVTWKVSGNGNTWHEFNLQTSTTSFKRIFGFANKKYDNFNKLQQSCSPVKFRFLIKGSDILNRQSEITELQNIDVVFSSTELKWINEVSKGLPRENAFFLVKVTVLKWNDPPKFVKVRGEENAIKEDFLLVDKTGNISMHVWGDNIKEIEDEKTSINSNVLLWQFLGKKYKPLVNLLRMWNSIVWT